MSQAPPQPAVIAVESLDDPRLEWFRMVRDRDLAGRAGAFMIEGRVALEAALLHGRHRLLAVLVTHRRVPALAALLARLPATVPIYGLAQEQVDHVVGFNLHRGLMVVAERAPTPSPAELLAGLGPGPRTVLVAEGLTDADNVGACFRNAAAFGADAVMLDAACCDPLYRKAVRVSAGHALGLPYCRQGTAAELVAALSQAGFTTAAMALSARAVALTGPWRPAERLALMVGTEGTGLSAEALEAADVHLQIPMAPGIDSLNVAVAAAVGLFATRRPLE